MNADSKTKSDTEVVLPGLSAGQALKHFRVESLLGEGGMGLVYRAQDTKLHRPVAVKLLAAAVTSDPERKQRFLHEARAAARISHPAVAQIYYVDEEQGVTFLAMELVQGKTVRQLIQNRELDLLGTIDIAVQVAEGLAKAHELGIVHRDIKPANVMLTPDGHAKILDFGLAKLLDRPGAPGGGGAEGMDWTQVTQTGMLMGTAGYMSPEQVRGVPVDARADIFSLGAMLFEMATGQKPFERETFMDTLHAVAFEETPVMHSVRAHIPGELQRIVARCLRKRADDRYPDARILAQDLRKLRRDTEAGLAQKSSWRQRLAEAWEQVRHMPPSRYVWYALGLTALAVALSMSLSRIGAGGVFFLALGALFLYRYIRNRPYRLQASFVRRLSKIPEVRLILIQGPQITVVVDRPVAQLYGRINDHLRQFNRKLFFGPPRTVSIVHEVSPPQLRHMLAGPGVEYVRKDVVDGKVNLVGDEGLEPPTHSV